MTSANVGARIRAFRKAANLHQWELAEKLNVGQSTVSMWERDDYDLTPKLSALQQIATACNTDLQYLMFGPLPGEPDTAA